jgi:alkanesulfonate monooxygenase SsuD/methylene tetrahydromethanopterin reductase-like flavin-dependent oxidoreductase (luciferase family)
MPDYGRELQFGAFIPPLAAQAVEVVELARLADVVGLDVVTFQDHPYRESVDALAEAIALIRAVWRGDGAELHVEGEHYRLSGGRAGPAPVHPVEIWLGAYKPRMLALTGRTADGWVPSMGYAAPEELPAMQARIDDAALAAGRSPTEIRRLYNVNGEFGSADGLLRGAPADGRSS